MHSSVGRTHGSSRAVRTSLGLADSLALLLLPIHSPLPRRTQRESVLTDEDMSPSPRGDTSAAHGSRSSAPLAAATQRIIRVGCHALHPAGAGPLLHHGGASCRGLVLGTVRRAASASPPTPCNLRHRILLPQTASPWLCQHSAKPAAKGMAKRGRQEGERPDPVAEAAALGGLRKLPQLQPVPVATRPVGTGVPSLMHSVRCTLHRPVPSRLGAANLTHVSHPHMAAGSSWRRSRSPLKARHSQGWSC